MADEDLDLNHDGVVTGDASFGVRKDIALKLKPSPSKGRRGRKPTKHKKDEVREEAPRQTQGEYEDEEVQLPTMKGPSEPQHKNKKLRWDHKVHLIGEKVLDPLIHCCETCALPILIYGRMIPCKHVFCLDCARKTEKNCPRCHDGVVRIEQAALGTVFVCTHGGAKHGVSGCRRTYLSNRDLQAHIQYRHLREQTQPTAPTPQQQLVSQQQPAMLHQRQDYPIHNTIPGSSAMVSMTSLPPPQLGQSQQGSRPVVYHGNQDAIQQQQQHLGQAQQLPQLSLPQTFTSPPPPTMVQGQTLGQGQVVLQQQQGYSQPPPTSTIESYRTIPIMSQLAPAPGGNHLISIPMQRGGEGGGGGGGVYHGSQGLSMSQPPPNYPPPLPLGANVPPQGYPPVSFAGTSVPQHHTQGGPPPPGPPRGHLPLRPGGGGPPVSTHGGLAPRFGPGQTPPYSQQQSGPPPGGQRPWQAGPGQGGPPTGPPPRGPPPPPCGPGVGPPRY